MQPFKLFGIKIGERPDPVKEIPPQERPFETPQEFDGTTVIENIGGIYGGSYINSVNQLQDENRYVVQYRNMSMYPECDSAISELVDAAVVPDQSGKVVELNLDRLELSENVKYKMISCFNGILKMLDFNMAGADLFRRWYVDSKIAYAIMVDNDQPKAGIKKVIPLDPLKITKVKEFSRKETNLGNVSIPLVNQITEYYIYKNTDKDTMYVTSVDGIKIQPDSIAYVHSGLIDYNTKRVVGYLHKAIRPLNMLRQAEDALLVYRIARAPERRVYYVDTGKLSPVKAEQYITQFTNRFRNRLEYNSASGEIKSNRAILSVLEDIIVPRMEGTQGTKIEPLPGGQAMGQIEDVQLFQKKVYAALNVPSGRLGAEGGAFNMGRAVEISREEVKFYKFILKLRRQFSKLFLALLRVECILKGILTEEDWEIIKQDIDFKWNTDNHFYDLMKLEMLESRMRVLPVADQYNGKYFSTYTIQKSILGLTDEDIAKIEKENIDFQKKMQRDILKTEHSNEEQNTEDQGTQE